MTKEDTPTSRKTMLYLPNDMFAEVENYRFENRFDSRADAMRDIIRIGLDTINKEKQKGKHK